ncbi:alpha/beta hydrolase [Synechococcus sp. PCC 7336]|uniref:alpha/beta hydrolase n=1 Tax=Synechococcus sp. PCC 7336 TaxID=195250 RepID=UPI00034907F7|nr:hypothetical protein [Synechococcus sp. PCC 7336]
MTTVFRATLAYYLNQFLCRWTGEFRAKPPAPPDYSQIYTSDLQPPIHQGICKDGSYIEIHKPSNPYLGDNNRPKCIIYLHGFTLGPSRIYGEHIEHLVKQGYYVFYPNFQTGFCHFQQTPFQTLEALIDAVLGEEALDSQELWMGNALSSVQKAYESENLLSQEVDTYLFGHSLGGLFALSWPSYVKHRALPQQLLPQQVVVADPIPSSDPLSGKLGDLLEKIIKEVDIKQTGQDLTMPVGILHGNDDWVIAPQKWLNYFEYIASPDKKMYLSFTDAYGCPAMYANHEQATDDTSFFPPFLALTVLDGVGVANNLDWRYIWHALDRVLKGDRADRLTFDMGHWSDGHPVKPIQVYLPRQPKLTQEKLMLL